MDVLNDWRKLLSDRRKTSFIGTEGKVKGEEMGNPCREVVEAHTSFFQIASIFTMKQEVIKKSALPPLLLIAYQLCSRHRAESINYVLPYFIIYMLSLHDYGES